MVPGGSPGLARATTAPTVRPVTADRAASAAAGRRRRRGISGLSLLGELREARVGDEVDLGEVPAHVEVLGTDGGHVRAVGRVGLGREAGVLGARDGIEGGDVAVGDVARVAAGARRRPARRVAAEDVVVVADEVDPPVGGGSTSSATTTTS